MTKKDNSLPFSGFFKVGFVAAQVFAVQTFCSLGGAFALPMGEKQIENFQREATQIVKEILNLPREENGNNFFSPLSNAVVKGLHFKSGNVTFVGISPATLKTLCSEDADFEVLRKIQKIKLTCAVSSDSLQNFAHALIQRQNPEKRLFENIHVELLDGKINIDGQVKMGTFLKIPFSFFNAATSKFRAVLSFSIQDEKIFLEIKECWLNGISISSEQRNQITSRINPIWDFSKLPYPAGINLISLEPSGLSMSGWLFAK